MKRHAITNPQSDCDARVEKHGTLAIVKPCSREGNKWLKEHLAHAMRWGTGFVVEPRYLASIIEGMINDNLLIGE